MVRIHVFSPNPSHFFSMDDTHSTASSSKSDDKVLNGIHPLDAPIEKPSLEPMVDEEGYIIRGETHENHTEPTAWSSCSSDEEDENELQQSKIRALTIRPADRPVHMNASVDELRDAIGSITLTRSTTFDRDPWTIGGSKAPPLFSQSMNASSLRQPLRSHHTADGRFRTNFSESEDPPAFSVSMGHNQAMAAGIARARPRSNTPTTSQFMSRKDSTSSFMDPWSSTFNLAPSESNHSLGESTFNLSQSTGNLLQVSIHNLFRILSYDSLRLLSASSESQWPWLSMNTFMCGSRKERTILCSGHLEQ